jgi:hypothetical protein
VEDQVVFDASSRFRRALDRIDPKLWTDIYIDRFPHGACGHCAELLGKYLRQELKIEAEYVCAEFYHSDGSRNTSHAWLEWVGLVIDISGDQFGWEPVIVVRSSTLHATGEIDIRQPLCNDMQWWATQCGSIWAAAIDQLEA